jgi:outer membrane protein assembly factor BamB
MSLFLRAVVALLFVAVPGLAGDWPAWRGPDGQGHTAETGLPLKWSPTDNVRWKVPLPEPGNSTPIIWGDRLFLTQSLDKGTRRAVRCYARADGKLLWERETPFEGKEPTHQTNPYCSASPVTDGERVIASLGSAGMVCYDFEGKELWRKDLGPLVHIWGNASSPVLHRDLAILWCGPGTRQFLLAVNKTDGRTAWEHQEPGGKGGPERPYIGSWTTPLVVRVGDHDELILGVSEKLKGFEPMTGKELWSCAGLKTAAADELVYTSPVFAGGIVVAMGGFSGAAMAVRAGGKGDVTATHRLWYHPRNPQRIGSPVIVGGHVYVLNDDGTAQCLELKTGKEIWKGSRLGGAWGSMVAAGERLYVTTKAGDTLVLRAAPEYELLAKNPLHEPVLASLAVADGDLFIRSHQNLWCIGGKNKTEGAGAIRR